MSNSKLIINDLRKEISWLDELATDSKGALRSRVNCILRLLRADFDLANPPSLETAKKVQQQVRHWKKQIKHKGKSIPVRPVPQPAFGKYCGSCSNRLSSTGVCASCKYITIILKTPNH